MNPVWRNDPFDAVIADESGGNEKTPQSEFLPIGRFAVVDQGKELIAGYVNDEARLCRAKLPVIVFGDHTRCFKYVDFPFCIGAEGVKVLRPKSDADVKYLFHYLRQLRLTEGGYARHYKYLRRANVVLPPVPEQRRIAEILDKAAMLRTTRCAALAQLETLTESIFVEMFGDPATNPRGFATKPLMSLIRRNDTINYGVVQPGEDVDDGIPLVRVGDLRDGRVNLSSLKRIDPYIEAAYKRSRLHGDEILVSCVGSIGVVALADESVKGFNIARAVARIPLAETTRRIFLFAYLKTNFVQRYFTSELRTVSQPTLNIKQLSETAVVLPPIELQMEFEARVTAVARIKVAGRASLEGMDTLFASLQHRAFREEL